MPNNDLGQYLKRLRRSLNYSQEFVALQLNITRQTYSHYETGRITPPSNSLYNLAQLFGVPVENFLDYVVTYNIPTEMTANNILSNSKEDLDRFYSFINSDVNSKKFKYLDTKERMLIYYYSLLDERDQRDLLKMLFIRCENDIK